MSLIQESEIISIVSNQFAAGKRTTDADIVITRSTQLARDLGFSSIEFVVIFEQIQALRAERINFIDLIMPDRSTYVEDLSVSQILQFLNCSPSSQTSESHTDPYTKKRDVIRQEDVDALNQAIRHQTYQQEKVNTSIQLCFLLSSPRSGSTLLRRMLGCHPDIYAPMELHLMSYLDFQQRHHELSDQKHRHLLEGTVVARQEVRGMKRSISAAVDQMYARDRRPVSQFFSEIDPHLKQKVLVDKTPTYAFSKSTLERIKKTFPQAKFIHLKRCPNAVIKSMIDSELSQLIPFQKTSGIHTNRFAEALWCLCEQNIRMSLRDVSDRAILINYESLFAYPEATMTRLHKFLGLTPSTLIDPYSNKKINSEEQAKHFAGDLKTYLRKSIDPSVANEWKKFDSLQWLSPPTLDLLSIHDLYQEDNQADPY